MVHVDFSYQKANNFIIREKFELIELQSNLRFQLPGSEKAISKTMSVVRDGQVLLENSDNGFVVLTEDTFELKQELRGHNTMWVSYLKS